MDDHAKRWTFWHKIEEAMQKLLTDVQGGKLGPPSLEELQICGNIHKTVECIEEWKAKLVADKVDEIVRTVETTNSN